MFKKTMLFIVLLAFTAAVVFAGGSSEPNPTAIGTDADGDGIPDSAEPTLHTDPSNSDTDGDRLNDLEDPSPLFADNPIQENSTTVGFKIDNVLVENNVDAKGRGAPDHLELQVTSTSKTTITGFDVYYTITDLATNDQEAYYRELPGFSLAAGETRAIHFNNTGAGGHFSVNPNSMYTTNENEKMFDVTLHAKGYAPVSAQVKKDAGGAEEAD